MDATSDLSELATRYHKVLPERIRQYLNRRGIPDPMIGSHLLGWNGERITIPIKNREGIISTFKLAKDPEDKTSSPKMLAERGAGVELYGWESVLRKPTQIIVCEGEFDRLVLEANGFCAATSTGGAGVFRKEWAAYFPSIPEVYVCYDNDAAGRQGAERVGRMIPHARIIELPEEVGMSGDVTDFFIRLGKCRSDFQALLAHALPVMPDPPAPQQEMPHHAYAGIDSREHDRITRIKSVNPIAEVVGRYVRLQASGERFIGLCPFHPDHHPSLVIFPNTGTFRCFACSERGDVITFLREIEGIGFREALEQLE